MGREFPELPEGACHWELSDGTIVYWSAACQHVHHKEARSGLVGAPWWDPDFVCACGFERAGGYIPERCPYCGGENRKSVAEVADKRLDAPFVSTSFIDPEWPSTLYATPADFFDDNQVIDA